MGQLFAYVNDSNLQSAGDGTAIGVQASKRGELRIVDFFTEMALQGRAYQVRAGTITTPLVGDVVLTDTAAEMATSVTAGLAIIPVNLGIAVRLGTGTLHEYAAKSVGVVHSAGTAFVALPLKMNSASAAASTSAVAAAGGVTVTAELATTTRRHWEYANPVAAGAGNDPGAVAVATAAWNPKVPPVLAGAACFYVQIAATGTGPSYYAHYDFIELPTANL